MATAKEMKTCFICKKETSVFFFYKNKSKKDGLHNICKNCMREKRRNSKFKEYISRSRSNRLKRGLCIYCSNLRLKHHSTFCEKHWFKSASRNNLKSVRHWEELIDIWHAQNMRCMYTGELLVPGLNMSLDHKDPKSRYNNNKRFDIGNLQWVTIRINISKHSMTHKEFIEMCGVVYGAYLDRCVEDDTNTTCEVTIEH